MITSLFLISNKAFNNTKLYLASEASPASDSKSKESVETVSAEGNNISDSSGNSVSNSSSKKKKKFYDPLKNGKSINNPNVTISPQDVKKYSRNQKSKATFFTDRDLNPLDQVTGRKHAPLINETIKVSPTGAKGSILNRIFQTAIEELTSSPRWAESGPSLKDKIDVNLLESYFEFVADMIAMRQIYLNLLQLYRAFNDDKAYEEDRVMSSILNQMFSGNFIPSRSQLRQAVSLFESDLSKFYLPPEFCQEVVNQYKFVSLPYQGYEILLTFSVLIPVNTSVFGKNPAFVPGGNENILIFPFDSKIMENPNDKFNIFCNIFNYFHGRMFNMITYGGEFSELHSMFGKLIPEWKVKLVDESEYIFYTHMSEGKRISLINQFCTAYSPTDVSNKFRYKHYTELYSVDKKFSSLYDIVHPTKFRQPVFMTMSSVDVDDSKQIGSNKWITRRTYDNVSLWHDSDGGFNLTFKDMLNFAIPFVKSDDSALGSDSHTPKVIVEPGLNYVQTHPDGLHILSSFGDYVKIDYLNSINVVDLWTKNQVVDNFLSIARRGGFFYDLSKVRTSLGDKKPTSSALTSSEILSYKGEIAPEMIWSSHPTLQKGSLDFNVLRPLLEEHFKKCWTSETLISSFNSMIAKDMRSEYKVYSVNVISD